MEEIENSDYHLNIARYVSTAEAEPDIGLAAVHEQLVEIDKRVAEAAKVHNQYLKQLDLPPLSANAIRCLLIELNIGAVGRSCR